MTSLLSTSALPLRLVLGPGSFEYLVKQPLVSFARYSGGKFQPGSWEFQPGSWEFQPGSGGGDVSEILLGWNLFVFVFPPLCEEFPTFRCLKYHWGGGGGKVF